MSEHRNLTPMTAQYSMEFPRSFFRLHFLGKPVVVSRNVGCFLKLTNTKYSSPEPLFFLLDLSFITHFNSPWLSSIWQPDPHRGLHQLHFQRHINSMNTLSWSSCGTWISCVTQGWLFQQAVVVVRLHFLRHSEYFSWRYLRHKRKINGHHMHQPVAIKVNS